jgi:hypothetical protein
MEDVISELNVEVDKCSKCGCHAGLQTSPEGECCGICGSWICTNCSDASVSLRVFILPNGERIAEDVICKDCSHSLGLHNLKPVEDL